MTEVWLFLISFRAVFLLEKSVKWFPLASKELGFPGGSDGKECAYNEGDLGLIAGLIKLGILQDTLEEGMTTHSSILTWRIW